MHSGTNSPFSASPHGSQIITPRTPTAVQPFGSAFSTYVQYSPRLQRPRKPRSRQNSPRMARSAPSSPGPDSLRYLNRSPVLSPRRRSENERPPVPIVTPPPNDRWFVVHWICMLQGLAFFGPWQMFGGVFEFYFLNHKMSPEYVDDHITPEHELKLWRDNFAVRITAASLITHLIAATGNLILKLGKGKLGTRSAVSLLILITCYLVHVFVTITDTTESFNSFMYIMLLLFVVKSFALGIYQSCIWAIISQLPGVCCNALLIGSNLGGVLVCCFVIGVGSAGPDVKVVMVMYLLFGTVVLLTAFGSYFAMALKRFFRFYVHHMEVDEIQRASGSGIDLWRKRWIHFLDVFLAYFVTYFIYPNVAMWIDVHEFMNAGSPLGTHVFCFLTFNVCAVLGNIAANLVKRPGPRLLWVFTYVRLFFVPYFALLNYSKPDRVHRFDGAPLANGWFFWPIMIFLSLTHGYASSLSMIYITRFGSKAAMIALIFLILGIMFGLAGSLIFDKLLL